MKVNKSIYQHAPRRGATARNLLSQLFTSAGAALLSLLLRPAILFRSIFMLIGIPPTSLSKRDNASEIELISPT